MTGEPLDLIEPIRDFCRSKEVDLNEVILDDTWQQVKTDNFKGWYIGHKTETKTGSPFVVFVLGNWKTAERHTFKYCPVALSKAEEKLAEKQIKLIEERARREQQKIQIQVAEEARKEFENMRTESENPYLVKKKLKGLYGAKSVRNSFSTLDLVIPMFDESGVIWGYQTIDEVGNKQYKFNQRTSGLSIYIGVISPKSEQVFLCEGFATAISIHEATHKPVVCCFASHNLVVVAKKLREILGNKPSFIICGDNDRYSPDGNAGEKAARKAAYESKAHVVLPEFCDDDTRKTDFNDLHFFEGIDKVREQLSQKFLPADEIIETEHTGFHRTEWRRGVELKLPDYEGLVKYFERKHHFYVNIKTEAVLIYDGKIYRDCSVPYMRSFAEEHFDPKPNSMTVEEFVKKVRRNRQIDFEVLEQTTKDKINFNNGILDIHTGQLIAHSKEYGFMFCLPYDYDPSAKAPRFEKMLNDVTEGNDKLKQLLCEFAGYCLSGDRYWIQKALILEGRGRNGKSTFIEALRAVLGQNNTSSISMAELNSEHKRIELYGKIANFSEEQPNLKMIDSSNFKSATSGGLLSGRFIYQRQLVFRNRAKMIFSLNELPDTSDKSEAFFKRFIIVPFNRVFAENDPDFDPNIEEKLKKEVGGIFNICYQAYQETKRRGAFDIPEESREVLQDYATDSDPIVSFLEETIEIYPLGNGHDDTFVEFRELYEFYCDYMDEANIYKLGRDKFSKILKHKIPDYSKRKLLKKNHKEVKRVIRAVKFC